MFQMMRMLLWLVMDIEGKLEAKPDVDVLDAIKLEVRESIRQVKDQASCTVRSAAGDSLVGVGMSISRVVNKGNNNCLRTSQ